MSTLQKASIGAILVVLGGGAAYALVLDVGTTSVLRAMSAGAWALPALLLLELTMAFLDMQAARALHGSGPSRGPALRGASMAYAAAQTAPGGRLLGEVLRALELAPAVGRGEAALGALVLHGLHVLAAAVVALGVALVVVDPLLSGLCLGTSAWSLGIGTLLLMSPRWAWVAKRFLAKTQLPLGMATPPRFSPHRIAGAASLLALARLVHLAQGAVVLSVVHAQGSPLAIAAVEAVQLVAANLGDAVPGNAGVLEGGFRSFAASVTVDGPALAAGQALAIALLLRTGRLALAGALGVLAIVSRAPRLAVVATLALALAASAEVASAQEPEDAHVPRLVLHQRIVGVVNPSGAEHMISLAVHLPLSPSLLPGEELFEGAHVEAGAVSYVSPIYAMTGGYVQFSPLAFLTLRTELSSVGLWPIGIDGAGYYPLDLEPGTREPETLLLPGAQGRNAAGINLQLGATLALAFSIGPFRPILWSQGIAELERVGEQPFRYSPRYDLVLARQDWMIAVSSLALLEVRASPEVAVRVGAFDDLRTVPRSGYINHVLGPVLMLVLSELDPAVPELLFFARAGAHLDDSRRRGEWTGLVGFMGTYEAVRLR